MDAETRERFAALESGRDNIATLLGQLVQLICYAEGIEPTEADQDEDSQPPQFQN